jgi:hypothetical protein
MSRAPIAHIPERIVGVNGYQTPGAIDSGADVNVMAMLAMKAAKLESRFRSGSPRFTQADGNESVASGWLDMVIGLGNNFELGPPLHHQGEHRLRRAPWDDKHEEHQWRHQLCAQSVRVPAPTHQAVASAPVNRPQAQEGTHTRLGCGLHQHTGGYLTAQGRDEPQETHLEDVLGGGQLATASPTGETEDAGNLEKEMGLPDLIYPRTTRTLKGMTRRSFHTLRAAENRQTTHHTRGRRATCATRGGRA